MSVKVKTEEQDPISKPLPCLGHWVSFGAVDAVGARRVDCCNPEPLSPETQPYRTGDVP